MLLLASGLNQLVVDSDLRSVGCVTDFLIEPSKGRLRYVLVTFPKAEGGVVALPAAACADPDMNSRHLKICLSELEIEDAAGIDLAHDLCRARENELHETLHWAPYWRSWDGNSAAELGGLKTLIGADVRTEEGSVGSLQDVLVDTWDWSVPLALIAGASLDTDKPVAVPYTLARRIDPEQRTIELNATLDQLQSLPAFDSGARSFAPLVAAVYSQFGLASTPHGVRAS